MRPHAAVFLASGLWLLPGAAMAAIDHSAPLDDRCWDQTFVEDFDTLDLYSSDTPDGRWKPGYIWSSDVIINQELQYYIDPSQFDDRYSPFSIDDGILTIEARPTPPEIASEVASQPYVSGVLTTENDFNQRWGRFEANIKVPAGRGLWSAFWLLPSFDQWPDGVAVLPEIDVMEFLGHEVRTVHTTLHTNQNGPLESHTFDHRTRDDLSARFHRYSVVWTADQVHWYLDREHLVSHPTPQDYTRPVHFLLNLAVGGTWPGNPDSRTRFPARMQVDSVTAWEDNGSC